MYSKPPDRCTWKALRRGLAVALACGGIGSVLAQQPSPPDSAPAPADTNEISANPTAKAATRYVEKELYIQVPNSFPLGLDAVEFYINMPGRHPLVLLTHGTSSKEEERQHVTPWSQLAQARWFARRGYVAIVISRKGYGRSGGERDMRYGGCGARGSFREAGEASADDLRMVAKWAEKLPEVDANTIVSAGVSTGGFAQVALAADPPRGLKAAISFAGGRGGDGKEHNCDLDGLIHAFRDFGKGAAKHGRVPMLWIYSQNDHWFPPAMAVQFDRAYQKAGGSDKFVLAPADGEDGHYLYHQVDAWSATVEAFLKEHNLLPLGDQLLPALAIPKVPPPPGLHDNGVNAWQHFLIAAPYKSFATSGKSEWGSASGEFDQAIADRQAMDRCKTAAKGAACQVVARTPASK